MKSLKEEFLELMQSWKMNVQQASFITKVPVLVLERWISDPTADVATIPDGLQSVQDLVAVRLKLKNIFKTDEEQCNWMLSPSPDFADRAPMDFAVQSAESLQWLNYFIDTRLSQDMNI